MGTDRTVLGYEWIIGELREDGGTYTRPVGSYFNKIGRNYYEAGELEAAAESLESSLGLDLGSEVLKEGFELLEDVYGGLGVERGLEGYARIEGRRPAEQYTNQDVMTLHSKGKFLREAGHLDQALEIFEGLIRDNEQLPMVKYQFPIRASIGDVYRDKNRIRESSEEYDKALDLINQHVSESDVTEELRIQIAETWMSLADNQVILGDHEGAKMSLGKAYIINPSDSVVAMQEGIEDLEDKGQYQVIRVASEDVDHCVRTPCLLSIHYFWDFRIL